MAQQAGPRGGNRVDLTVGVDSPKSDADRVRELEVEVAQLRERLAAAGSPAPAAKPTEPKFTFSEGQRDELARTGKTISPFTGKLYVGSSPEDAREVEADEFAKAKPAKPAEK